MELRELPRELQRCDQEIICPICDNDDPAKFREWSTEWQGGVYCLVCYQFSLEEDATI